MFGDGAGAVVAKHNSNAKFYEVISSRGDVEAEHIHIPGVPFAGNQKPSYCKMNGQEVFKFAVESPVQSIKPVSYTHLALGALVSGMVAAVLTQILK